MGRLKRNKKHNAFLRECFVKEQSTLSVRRVLPMHRMWCKYATEALRQCRQFNATVSKLDLHGCLVRITKCKSRQCYVDYEGIVVLVSKHRMGIVTTLPQRNRDKLVCIPLKGTQFTFKASERLVTIYGDKYAQFVP